MGHTKGPWKAKPFLTPERDDDPMMVYEVIAGDLQVRYDNIPMDADGEYDQDIVSAVHAENESNARLIAAAPDLLAALEAVMSMERTQGVDDGTVDRILQQADAALAKAKGV